MITKKMIKLPIALLGCFLISGCASMFGDNTRDVKVDSNPKGADIFIDGTRRGTTPAVVTLPSYIYGGKEIVLKKKDYSDQTITVNSKFQPVTIWNLFNGFGFIVDAATGDVLKIDPRDLNVSADLSQVSK